MPAMVLAFWLLPTTSLIMVSTLPVCTKLLHPILTHLPSIKLWLMIAAVIGWLLQERK